MVTNHRYARDRTPSDCGSLAAKRQRCVVCGYYCLSPPCLRGICYPRLCCQAPEGCGFNFAYPCWGEFGNPSDIKEHKNVEPVLLPVPQCKGSRIARLVETNNAESPTQNVYSVSLHVIHTGRQSAIRIHYGLSINTLRGVPVALFLTNRLNLRDSYTVKTKASRKRLCP